MPPANPLLPPLRCERPLLDKVRRLLAMLVLLPAAGCNPGANPGAEQTGLTPAAEAVAVLQAALAAEVALGSFRATSHYQMPSGLSRTEVKCVSFLPDKAGRAFTTIQYTGRNNYQKTTLLLSTDDGQWVLLPGTAIRLVDQVAAVRQAIFATDSAQELTADRYRVERLTEGGRAVTKVTTYFPGKAREALARQIHKVKRGQGVSLDQVRRLVSARRVYTIDGDWGIIVSVVDQAQDGTVLTETHVDQVERAEFPDALFEIPAGAVRLYPKTAEEFARLYDEYGRAEARSSRRDGPPAQQTTSKEPARS
jgi:hypothetical protein